MLQCRSFPNPAGGLPTVRDRCIPIRVSLPFLDVVLIFSDTSHGRERQSPSASISVVQHALADVVELDLASFQSATIGGGISGHPTDYLMLRISWYQEQSFWNHQFIVARFQRRTPPSHVFFACVERDKTEWLDIWTGNLVQTIRASATEGALTINSFLITEYHIDLHVARQSRFATLQFLGSLLEAIQAYSSQYTFLTCNCWWFAGCCFDCIVRLMADANPTAPTPQATNYQAAAVFGSDHYFRSQWPYWMLLGYAVVIVTSISSFVTNWSFLAYLVPCLLVAAWTVYYLTVLADAWRIVREKLGDGRPELDQAVSSRLAWRTMGVSFVFILYGLLFFILAFSPALAIAHVRRIAYDE